MAEVLAAFVLAGMTLTLAVGASLLLVGVEGGVGRRAGAWAIAVVALATQLGILRTGLERDLSPAASWVLLAEPAVALAWLWYLTRRMERPRA